MSPAPLSAVPSYPLLSNLPRAYPTSDTGSSCASVATTNAYGSSIPICSPTYPAYTSYPTYSPPPSYPTCSVQSIYPGISTTICTSASETPYPSYPTPSTDSCSCPTAPPTSYSGGYYPTPTGPSTIIYPSGTPQYNGTTPYYNTRICSGISQDGDISGVGIRITFYITNFLMVTGAVLKRFDPEGPYWVTWCTTTALLISAAVEAGNHHLSLYNAIIVSYLCFLHTISAIWLLAVRNVCGDRKRALRYLPFTIIQMCGFAIYAFYIWSHAKDFGNQPECNSDTKFIFFFKGFSAVHTGPKIAIPILSVLFLVGLVDAGRYVRMWNTNAPPEHERSGYLPPVVGLYILAWVYVVATTELTIKRNWIIDDPSKFSFGQILPLVTIGIPIIAILLALRVRNRQRDQSNSPQEQLIQELPAERPIAQQQMEEPSDFEQRGT